MHDDESKKIMKYEKEGLNWEKISFVDNIKCIDLIEVELLFLIFICIHFLHI
jgi:myosin heavy subunit